MITAELQPSRILSLVPGLAPGTLPSRRKEIHPPPGGSKEVGIALGIVIMTFVFVFFCFSPQLSSMASPFCFTACEQQFVDLSGTIFEGHHRPLRV
jgi:hypothetical protein